MAKLYSLSALTDHDHNSFNVERYSITCEQGIEGTYMNQLDRSLKTIVGSETYRVWINMLRSLVPEGRTHRLAPLVAGMLQYAAAIAYEKYGADTEEGSVAYSLVMAPDTGDPEEVMGELLDITERLFDDAGVPYGRASRRGDQYSVAESAIYEFVHWYDMPWEA
jgi:hypothetical protein